ncbi:MAG: amidohydrolase family protein [Xanthobacteraceae bacterium]
MSAPATATSNGRLVGFASVALQFPELAAEQLEFGMKHLGLVGGAIGPTVEGEELSSARFDPFWAKCEELDALLFMHPQDSAVATGVEKRVRGKGYLVNTIGNPLETTIALSHLIFEGTLDRFPKLRLCAASGRHRRIDRVGRYFNGGREIGFKECRHDAAGELGLRSVRSGSLLWQVD